MAESMDAVCAAETGRAPRRGIWGWMLFDWAAQPFFTVVATFLFRSLFRFAHG